MYDDKRVLNKHLEWGIHNGELNAELVNDDNIRIICCGTPVSEEENEDEDHEWFYYNMTVFKLMKEELEKLYKTDVGSFAIEWFDNNGLKYGDEGYDRTVSQLYIIPNCIRVWYHGHDDNGNGFIYRDNERISKLAFEEPDIRIITKYMWSEDSDNIYRVFNRVIQREHERQLDLNKKLSDLLMQAVTLVR